MRKNLAIIILTAGGLLAVFFLTFYMHQTNKGKTLFQFNENQLQIARQTAIQIESYLRSRSHDLRRLSSSAAPQDPDRKRMAADIQSNFGHLKAIKIKEISLFDEKGTAAYSTTAVAMGENHSQDNFFSWARDPVNKNSVWIGYEKADGRRIPVTAGSPASTHIGIFLVTPLYRESTTGGRQKPGGKFAGALMFKVDLEGMLAERSLLFTPLMKLHRLWIMDKDGTVLLQSEHPEMLMRSIREKDGTCNQCHPSFDHVETMLGKAEGATEYQIKGEKKKVAAFALMSFGNVSWIVVVNAPLDEVTAFVREDLKKTFLLLGILVFVLGIAFFLAYRNYREKVDHETAINTLLSISLLNIHLEEQLAKMFEIIISIPWLKVDAKGCIFLVKEKSDVLVMVVQKGLDPSLVTICAEVPFGRCLCGRAALTGEIEFANSVDERHDNLYEGVSPHGHYCVPIKFHDKVLGVLNLYLRAGHRRDAREEEFLKAVTDVMAGIIERKRAEESIHLLAYYDSLTSLPNRTFFKELMQRSIEHAKRHKEIFALIYIGLDNFQRINDTLGHSIGDLLLKAVADRLAGSLRRSDYVARSDEGETTNVVSRVGGDEFIVLAHDLTQVQDAAIASHRLLKEISDPYDLNGHEVFITASIGISLYPDDGADVDDLLKNADTALEHAKKEGKNNYQFYSRSMNSSVLELLTLENDLRKALERNELVLYYQPKVDAATRMVKGMEALIRWKHPDRGLIPPMQFIPLAEASGLIVPIGEFVIRTVCMQSKQWQEAGYKQMNIALNVSSRQFDQQGLIEIVKDALQNAMISPQCLELEITESIIMRNPEKAVRTLTELKAMGIQIAIDDFGTGYSSLSYLKRLPLDFLKIDQSFIKNLTSDPNDQAIVRATIAMAHSLNLKTIAEGVETEEQLTFLQEHGCDEIQGYLFSRPLPTEEIPGILAKGYL